MPDIFEPVIRKLFDIGFGNVIIFFLSSAIFYALLRKTRILGDSEMINGTVAVLTAFMIGFWFPIFTGTTLVTSMSAFFAQATTVLIFIIVGFLMAGIFYPDLAGMLAEQFKHRTTLYVMLALAIMLFITSGLVSSLWSAVVTPRKPGEPAGASPDIYLIGAALILFIVVLLVGASAAIGSH
jgi:hypothetical protein